MLQTKTAGLNKPKEKEYVLPCDDIPKQETKSKKMRVAGVVKNAGYFLYTTNAKFDKGEYLLLVGSYRTEVDIREAYKAQIDSNVLPENLKGFKGRELKFNIKKAETKVTIAR